MLLDAICVMGFFLLYPIYPSIEALDVAYGRSYLWCNVIGLDSNSVS